MKGLANVSKGVAYSICLPVIAGLALLFGMGLFT